MKIKTLALSILVTTLSFSATATVNNVNSIRSIDYEEQSYIKDRNGDHVFFLGGQIKYQPKNYNSAEDLINQWKNSNTSLFEPYNLLLENYPSIPETQEGQAIYTDTFAGDLNDDTEFKKNIDSFITETLFSSGLLVQEGSPFMFYGGSNSHLYFIDLTSQTITTLYRCDKTSFNASVAIDDQADVCQIVEASTGYQFRSLSVKTVTSDDKSVISDNLSGTHKIFSGSNPVSPVSFGLSAEPNEIISLIDSMPLNAMFFEETGRSGLFTSTLPPKKVYTGQMTSSNSSLEFNNTYYAYIDSPLNDTAVLKICEYTAVTPLPGPFVPETEGYFICNNENSLDTSESILLDALTPLGSNMVQEGYIRSFALSPTDKLATAYYGGTKTMFPTPLVIDINTGEETYLAGYMKAALVQKLGTEFMTAVEDAVLESLDDAVIDNYPNMPDSPESARLPADITQEQYTALITEVINRFALQDGVYSDFLTNDRITNFYIRRDFQIEEGHWNKNSFRFLNEFTLQTPIGTFEFESDEPLSVEGTVKLPGTVVPEGGIEVTLLGDQGDRHELLSNANSVFSITNPSSDNYEITFSYPNHVFECANVDLSSGTFGEFEMLAGDVNNDGEISSADQWIFYFRAFYPSTDFDLNNDGVVNNTDRNIISTNRGAVQCDL